MQLLTDSNYDLRDPKFFVNNKNNLQLVFGASLINKMNETAKMVPQVALLEEGHWKVLKACGSC